MRTPCGRFIGTRTYSLSWAPTFRGRLALPCCVLIISQILRFVKTFLKKVCWRCDSNAHHPFADSTEDTSHRWENPTRTGGVAHRGTLRNRRTPSAFFCQVLYFSEKILGENLVAVFPIEWVLDASAYHSCGTGKGFSVGCPSHSRCFRLPAQRMQLLSSLCT